MIGQRLFIKRPNTIRRDILVPKAYKRNSVKAISFIFRILRRRTPGTRERYIKLIHCVRRGILYKTKQITAT